METKALNYSVPTVSSQGECHIIEAMSRWVTLLRLGHHDNGRGWAWFDNWEAYKSLHDKAHCLQSRGRNPGWNSPNPSVLTEVFANDNAFRTLALFSMQDLVFQSL